MNNDHHDDFTKIVKDAGIPITDEEITAIWNQYNAQQGSLISNNTHWSPFWRLITAIVTAPCKWVVNFLITHLLPNSFIKTANDSFLDILAWGLNIERKKGVKARGALTFERINVSRTVTIPAGTIVQSTPINGTVYRLETLNDATFDDNAKTVTILSQALETGSAFNLAPGYYRIIIDPVDEVIAVTNQEQWLQQPGTDDESNESLRLRCRNQFTSVGDFYNDAVYKAIITEFSGIQPDYIWFQHGAPRGAGSANVYLMLPSGPAPDDLVNDINQHINVNGYHGHGDDLQCFPMPIKPIDLNVILVPVGGLTAEQEQTLQTQCEQMIRCAFRENQDFSVTLTWPFARFSKSRLAQELHDFFPNIESLLFEQGDIQSQMEIPTLNTIKLTVQHDANTPLESNWVHYRSSHTHTGKL